MDILALISYGIVIYVLTLKTFWIVMLVVPGTVNSYSIKDTHRTGIKLIGYMSHD